MNILIMKKYTTKKKRLVCEMVKYFVARWKRHILKLTASFAEYDSFVDGWNFEASPDLIVEIKAKEA